MSNWYKGQYVFWRCAHSDIGIVQRSSDNHGWVEVKWLDRGQVTRHKKENIEPLSGVLNYWLIKDGAAYYSNCLNVSIPKSERVAVTSTTPPSEEA